jgi:phosphohistidine phosphatase
MNLYLIRHSIAEKISLDKKDFDRELSEHGRSVLANSIECWKHYCEHIDVIYSSPLIRAVQTAEIISSNLQNTPKIIKDNVLGSGGRTADLIDLLNSIEFENIAIVGHQPDLSYHVNNFCGNGTFNLSFPPPTIAKIEFDNVIKYGKGRLAFLIPSILSK